VKKILPLQVRLEYDKKNIFRKFKMEKNWSELSKDFDQRQQYVAGKEVVNLITDKIQALKDIGDVLELGCGNGFYSQYLAKAASSIIATDISKDMVAVARKKLADHKNIKVEISDAYKTEYEDCSFDTIFMANLIHVVEHPDIVLRESKRILKPQGRLIISTFTTYGMDDKEIEEMFKRYLQAFGQPPKGGKSYTLDSMPGGTTNGLNGNLTRLLPGV
jgi:ubiquinone/menaquinone biosynthesis C-methylase UbiE